MRLTRTVPLLILLFSSSQGLFPGGVAEPPETQTRVYLVLKEDPSETFLDRFYLPPTLASYEWSEFEIDGDDIIFRSQSGYRIVSKHALPKEKLGALFLYRFDVQVDFHSSQEAQPTESRRVAFSYEADDQRAPVAQPAREALLRVIKDSGKTSGWIKLLELDYAGNGEFRATIGIR
jgi:hypothetical protein